jgi:hypothetical protein
MADQNKDKQGATLVASIIVVVAFTIYWVAQIQGVREMLALAYG